MPARWRLGSGPLAPWWPVAHWWPVAPSAAGGGLVGFAEAEGAVSASFSGCEVEHAAATETSNATREVTPPVRTE